MTQSATWFLEAGERVFSSMASETQAFVAGFLEDTDGLEGQDLTFVQAAYGLRPEALTVQHVTERSPYGNPLATADAMRAAVSRGWLEPVGEDRYELSTKAKRTAESFFARADEFIGALAPTSDVNLERIVVLLQKVVDRARLLQEPREKTALATGALFDRGSSASFMVQVRRRMLDLFAFRDDTHVAAWQPYDVSGHAWEAFTFVWRGEARTAAELAEQLPHRSYDETAYAAALQDVADRGWIVDDGSQWLATQAGKELRQEAEDATNRLYDAAWTALEEPEVDELKQLLGRLAEAVKPTE